MNPEDLELEITETVLMDSHERARAAIDELRAAGIRIALDDFGTGYSSLTYLNSYPVDRIKIDKTFISQMNQSAVSSTIVHTMINLAGAMSIKVTAEGVETSAHVDHLKALGCDTLQGFHIAPSLPLADIEARLRESFHQSFHQPAVSYRA